MAQSIDPVGKHLPLKLGKKPARPGAVKFKLANYLDKAKLPTPPKGASLTAASHPKSALR